MFEQFYISSFFVPIIAFLLVVTLVMPFRKLARIAGIVDKPDDRKQHGKAIPPIGGLVIFTVFMVWGVVSGAVDLHNYWALYMSLIVLLVSGAMDDQFHISAKIKFFIHIFAACLIAFMGNVQAAYMGDLFGFGMVWTGFMSYPFTIVAVVLLINAVNLMDGMDGLAGGVSAVIFLWMMVAAIIGGWLAYAQVLAVLVACITGFLVFNMRNPWRRSASLFLGDAGSMSLGLTIAWFAVLLARSPAAPIEPIAVAWIIGFPIFDTCAQFYRRVRAGRDPFSPDRGHFHHHFIDAGIPVRRASVIIIAIVAIMGGIGYGGVVIGIPPFVLTIGWVALLFIHIAISSKPERYVRIIKYFSGHSRKRAALVMLFLPMLFLSSCVDNFSSYDFIRNENDKPVQNTSVNSSEVNHKKSSIKKRNFISHKVVNTEKLLNVAGNWNIAEQGESYDPAKAHLAARNRVNVKRRGNKSDLVAHFDPDAESGKDGKLRVLRIKSGNFTGSDRYSGYNVTETSVAKPTKAVAGRDLMNKISTLFGSQKSDIIVPPRKPVRGSAAVVVDNIKAIETPLVTTNARVTGMETDNGSDAIIVPPKLPARKITSKNSYSNIVVPKPKPVRGVVNDDKHYSSAQVIKQVGSVKSAKRSSVVKMRAGTHPNMTRVVVEVTDVTKYKVTVDHLRNVLRLKLENTSWDIGPQGNINGSALLGSYIVRKQKDGSVLLEVRLKRKVKISDTMILRPNITSKHRIVIDLKAM